MAFKVIRTPAQYVEALLQKERTAAGPLCFASSFISSIYFSEEAIRRFYGASSDDHSSACNTLLKRRSIAISSSVHIQRREIYESAAFMKFLSEGTVHAQDSKYRSLPSEIETVLRSLLHWATGLGTLQIAVTTEILPVVFAIYSPTETIVDIRTNYLYQRIQGFSIDDAKSTAAFVEEFERLWEGALTEMTSEDVLTLIAENLRQWQNKEPVELLKWPRMRATDHDTD